MSTNPYEFGLDRNEANYASLTPISFLARTATSAICESARPIWWG